MVADIPCQQYTAPIFQLFRKEECVQKQINATQSTKKCEALVLKYQGYHHRINELIYHQERCDDRLFLVFPGRG